jgi:hypothetical protein
MRKNKNLLSFNKKSICILFQDINSTHRCKPGGWGAFQSFVILEKNANMLTLGD